MDRKDRIERRRFLGGAAALGALGVAGCGEMRMSGGMMAKATVETMAPAGLASEDPGFSVGARAGGLTFIAQDAGGPDNAAMPAATGPQAELALDHLRRALGAAGLGFPDVAYLQVMLTDYDAAPAVAQMLEAAFPPGRGPTTCFLGATALGGERKVRLDAVASQMADQARITVPGIALPPGGRCHAARLGDLVFVGGLDAPEPQSPAIEDHMEMVLRAAGTSLDNVICYFTFLARMSEASVRDAYTKGHNDKLRPHFKPEEFPAQSRIGLPHLGPGVAARSSVIATRGNRQYISSDLVRKTPGVFSQSVRTGDWLFLAGQDSVDVGQHTINIGDLAAQTERCLVNLENIMKAAGGSVDDIVKTRIYLQPGYDKALFLGAYRDFFKRRLKRPTPPAGVTLTVEVLRPDCLVEIDGVAWLGGM